MSHEKPSLDSLRINRDAAPSGGGKGLVALLAVVLLVAGGGVGYWWLNRTKPVAVKTALAEAPRAGADRTLLNASGYVTARREATVSSKVTGKVAEVLIEEGKRVEAGEVLARLDPTNVETNVRLAEAQVESAGKAMGETEALLERARVDLSRVESLLATMDVSQSVVDKALTDVKALEARRASQEAEAAVAERQLGVWQQELEDTIIRAPFAGVVISKDAQPGEMVSPISAGGGFTRTGICTIVDMSSLEIEVDVNESYINRVKEGMSVSATLDSDPQRKIPSRVIAIIPTADRVKATVKVRIAFEELDERIRPNMSVKVAFQSEVAAGEVEKSGPVGVTVPKKAVRSEGGRDVVWVVRGGKLERRAVVVGERLADTVVLSAGVSGGEVVVVEGPDGLVEGMAVIEEKP